MTEDADIPFWPKKTVAIIGYGSQGHAHCPEPCSIRASRWSSASVPGGPNWQLAK
jgi:ketol-acid reductoisomerase